MAIDISGYDPWSSVGGDMTGETTSSGGGFSAQSLLSAAGSFAAGPAGGLIGSIVGSLFGGGDKEAARKARRFQKQQADRQWDLATNAMQYKVKDLTAAGLNPMLAGLNQSGASGNISSPDAFFPTSTAKAQSAQQGARTGMDSAIAAAAIAKTLADTKLSSAQASEIQARIPTYASQMSLNESHMEVNKAVEFATRQHGSLSSATINKVQQEVAEVMSRTELNQAQKRSILEGQIPKMLSEIANLDYSTAHRYVETLLLNLDIPRAEREAAMHRSEFGAAKPYVDTGSKWISSAAGGLGSAIGGFFGARTGRSNSNRSPGISFNH